VAYRMRRCDKCKELINGNDVAFNIHFKWCGHNTGLNYMSEKDLRALEAKLAQPRKDSPEAAWNKMHNWSGKQ
jgi:hypothetical protein